MITITTVNVNGLRAASGKGFDQAGSGGHQGPTWSACRRCAPSTRRSRPQLQGARGWARPLFAPAAAKGRAGVGLYTRVEPTRTQVGFGSRRIRRLGPLHRGRPPPDRGPARRDGGQPRTSPPAKDRHPAARRRRSASWRSSSLYLNLGPQAPRGRRPRSGGLRRLEHRPPRSRSEKLEIQQEDRRLPARGARLAQPRLRRGKLRRHRPAPFTPTPARPLLLVVLPRPRLRQRRAGWRIDYQIATPGTRRPSPRRPPRSSAPWTTRPAGPTTRR